MPQGGELDQIFSILWSSVGIDFRLYKEATIRRRIARRMALRKIESLNQYAEILKQNPEEVHALVADIFIHCDLFLSGSAVLSGSTKTGTGKIVPAKI